LFLEIGHTRNIDEAEFDAVFETSLGFTSVIGLDGSKFVGTIDGFVVKDAIQLEGEFERRNVDVEFAVDGVFAVKVEFEGWVKDGQVELKPFFEFRNTSSMCFVGVVPFGRTGFTAKVIGGFLDCVWFFLEGFGTLKTSNHHRRVVGFSPALNGTEVVSTAITTDGRCN